MDSNCSYRKCYNTSSWRCICPGKPEYCDLHASYHYMEKQCQIERIEDRNVFKLKIGQNALKKIELECLKLAQEMINQINLQLKGTLKYLKAKKNDLKDFIHKNMGTQVNTILNWANTTNVANNNQGQFNLIVQKLFDINNSSRNFTNIEKFETDFDLKKELAEAYIKINEIEKLNTSKNNKVKDNEIDNYAKEIHTIKENWNLLQKKKIIF